MKKIAIRLFIVFSMLLVVTGCDFNIDNNNDDNNNEVRYKYSLKIPKLENIKQIDINTLGQYDSVIEVDDKETLKVLYDIFKDKKSNVGSMNENPDNPDVLYAVKIEDEEGVSNLFYYYKRDGGYYIEVPDTAIYDSDKEDFNTFEEIVFDRRYKLKLQNFKLDDIASVKIDNMGQFDSPIEYTDKENIDKLYKIFSNKGTNIKSEDYNPIEPQKLFVITFTNTSDETKQFYIYMKDNFYYIEVSFDGIYESTEKEFNTVKELFGKETTMEDLE